MNEVSASSVAGAGTVEPIHAVAAAAHVSASQIFREFHRLLRSDSVISNRLR
jgi:hypothetical protein